MKTYIESNSYKGYSVGDKIIINRSPIEWSSLLNPNCPIRVVEYPYKCTIKKIAIDIGNKVAMTDGIYGWSLSKLIYNNAIKIDLKSKRKNKLKKIKKYL